MNQSLLHDKTLELERKELGLRRLNGAFELLVFVAALAQFLIAVAPWVRRILGAPSALSGIPVPLLLLGGLPALGWVITFVSKAAGYWASAIGFVLALNMMDITVGKAVGGVGLVLCVLAEYSERKRIPITEQLAELNPNRSGSDEGEEM